MIEKTNYDAGALSVLKGLEPVRKRPGMYIGGKDEKAQHHMVWEIVDNSVDESLAGYCDEITVELNPEGYPENAIKIVDNGRGMPIDIHPEEKISGIEIIFTKLHGGGKFNNNNYASSGGLHGVGASVVNALSDFLEVTVSRNGNLYRQTFSKGLTVKDLTIIGKSPDPLKTGTQVVFVPDGEIMDVALEECGLKFNYDTIKERLKYTAYLNKKLKLVLIDKKNNKEDIFYSENGVVDWIKKFVKKEEKLITPEPFHIDDKNATDYKQYMAAEISFIAELENYGTTIKTYVNNINTHLGGKHLIGFRNALKKVVTDYAKNEMNKHESLELEDILEGCSVIISMRMAEPEYNGQTKESLTSSEAQSYVYNLTKNQFTSYFEENPDIAKKFVTKCLIAKAAREKSEKMKSQTRKELATSSLGSLPGKLAHCRSNKPEECEIFIVEGDSAGGSAKQARDKQMQAVLPLKGKILNTRKAQDSKILNSQEILNLVIALGTDFGENFNIEKLKYHKVILLMDADVDGAHIKMLAMTLFFSKLRPLITNGYIYIAKPPLFVLNNRKTSKKEYYLNEEMIQEKYPNGIPSHIDKGRFKGLGEMNPEELWETTMNPETRILERITIEDMELSELMVENLMGDDVQPRKEYLEQNADKIEL